MPYTTKNPPDWLKNLPVGAIKIGVEVFNSVLDETKDEEKARIASWSAIKAKYEKGDDGEWHAKTGLQSSEQGKIIRFRAARQTDASGLAWEAILIAPGLSQGSPRFYWSEEVLQEAAPVFEGVDINAYELTTDFFTHLPIPGINMMEDVKRYLVAKKVGWIEKTWWEEGVGIKATIRFLPEQAWLPRILQQGMDQGNDSVLGLSIDSRIQGMEVVVDSWTVIWVLKIISASSVDVVTYPAAGGKFLRAVAGLNNNYTEGKIMDKEKLLNLIAELKPNLLKGKDRAKLSDDEVLALARMAMQPDEPAAKADPAQRAAQEVTLEVMQKEIDKAVKEQELRAACGRMLDSKLAASDLPELTQQRVRKSYEGKTFKSEDLDNSIKDEKEYLAKMAGPGDPGVGNQSRAAIVVGLGSREKIQMAVDRIFGLTKEDLTAYARMARLDGQPVFPDLRAAQAADFDQVPVPKGILELYVLLTGDKEVNGRFYRENLSHDLRAAQDISSSTFTYVLGNTLARRLVKDYLATNFQEDLLISIRKPVKDFRQQEAVQVGYFGDLEAVDPETGDYQEIAGVTDEEATYSIGQKGNILTITRKTIINDDITLIQRLVSRLGRAARRTHAKYVWGPFINNGNCSDGTAWFTSGHGNLTTNTLGFANAVTAYKALAKMTEKDSGERIGLLDDPNSKPTLVYPIDLMETGGKIVNDDNYYTSNDLTTKTPNPLKGKIKGAMISLLTDATDWGLLMPPEVVDMVEMGYLNGRQEPEMFVADTPQSEQVFVADKVRYKIRHEYAGTAVDFRSGYKSENP